MGEIRRLPGDLANQIAAGEVVERPASVVKELLENALDAGATRIKVAIERGGIDLVHVSDDGRGMDAEDAVLSLERHATSKIRGKDDLFALGTFGFRGEALPSIASVAKLRLLTRMRGANEATEVIAEGGAPASARPAAAAEGTSVEVRELFFNVPARRKFLKAIGTEAAHVSDSLLSAALARPEVSFFLLRDGRTAREWLRVRSRRERAAQALDGERLESCVGERGPLRIEAHLGAPERARAGAVGLHLLVNGRPVRDRALARAVAQAYGSVLEPGRYPVGVVYVDLPAALVDVNVHPQKAEVRFAEARGVHDAVMRELHAGLGRAFSLPSLGRPHGSSYGSLPLGGGDALDLPPPSPGVSEEKGTTWSGGEAPRGSLTWAATSKADDGVVAIAERPADARSQPTLFDRSGFYASLDFVAQLRATFLLCSGADGLYVLDQHAAAERVTFHRLRHAFKSRSVATQRLLVAEVVDLLPAEVAALEEHAPDVAALGIEVRAVGANAVAVHSVPCLLGRYRPERLVRDVVAELGYLARRPFAEAADHVIATMACHGSVRAGDALGREECVALLRALDGIDFSGHCPHGRPVITRIGYDELERRVGR
ncbi:MAG TPA: DNA mismatch repair endonuclease MutL [Polyangiaceae bacterium]|nr:DNA mismatch repair endonuclease MutL [Polyangiaceae bacterium]